MIYKELHEIPLSRFISMYCGDLDALVIKGKHKREELERTASKLVLKYTEITGNRSIEADISMRNDLMNCTAKVSALESCLWLFTMGDYEQACTMVNSFGYKLKCGTIDEINALKQKIGGLLSENKMRIDMLSAKMKSKQGKVKIDRDYFEREKAIVMSYFKPFDDNEVKAQTYACWLKIMSEQVKSKKK